MAIKAKLGSLLAKANTKTEKQDTTLSEAVSRLIDGYGSVEGEKIYFRGSGTTKDNAYQALSTLELDENYVRLADGDKIQALLPIGCTLSYILAEKGGSSEYTATIQLKKNDEIVETHTVSPGSNTAYKVQLDLSPGDKIGFYKAGRDGWGTVVDVLMYKKAKIPTHYFLWINPEYGSVIESTYSPTVSAINPTEEV